MSENAPFICNIQCLMNYRQVAETRLGELEKCKYEVKRLQEDLSKSQVRFRATDVT